MTKLDLNRNAYPYTKVNVIAGIHHLCPYEKVLADQGIITDLPLLIKYFAFFLLTERDVYVNPTSVGAKYLTIIKRAARELKGEGYFMFEEEK